MVVSYIKYDKVVINFGLQPNGRVQKFFTQDCYNHMDKYVPKKTGMLRRNVDIGNDYIKYNQLYARKQYIGLREDGTPFTHYTTPGTGPYWDKKMWSAEKETIIQDVQNFIKRGK